MILRCWMVFPTPSGFVAKQWLQGHDGMKMLEPGWTHEEMWSMDLGDLEERLLDKYLQNTDSDHSPVFLRFKAVHPELLQLWW